MSESDLTREEESVRAARRALNFIRPGMVCAEVGVLRGYYSERILGRDPAKLVLIDSWHLGNHGETGDEIYDSVQKKFGEDSRVRIVRKRSGAAALDFQDETFDFVYLDADHGFHSVTEDLRAWFPKVKRGGILAGHDYLYPGGDRTFAVHVAVDQFWQGRLHEIEPLAFSNDWVLRKLGERGTGGKG